VDIAEKAKAKLLAVKVAEIKARQAKPAASSFEVRNSTTLSGVSPDQNSDITGGLKRMDEFQRSILVDPIKSRAKALAEKIPSDLSAQVLPNVPINVPVRSVARVAAEAGPEFLDAKNLALTFAGGPILSGAAKLVKNSPVVSVAKAAWKAVPDSVKKKLVYRFNQPEAYKTLAEKTAVLKGLAEEDSKKILELATEGLSRGKQADTIALPDGSTARNFIGGEQRRLDQILKGSISTNPAEAKLRERAAQIRPLIDKAEAEAKAVGLLSDKVTDTRAGRAGVRNRIDELKAKAAELRKNGALSQKWRDTTKGAIDNVSVKGMGAVETGLGRVKDRINKITGANPGAVQRQIDTASKQNTKLKQLIDETGLEMEGSDFKRFEDIMQNDTLRRDKRMQWMLERFKRASIGEKERTIGRLKKVAERVGARIDDINLGQLNIKGYRPALNAVDNVPTENVGVGGLKKLYNRVEQASGRFPGRGAIVRKLEGRAQELTNQLVTHYTESGLNYVPRKYLEDLADITTKGMAFNGQRLRLDRFKHRELIDPVVRKAKGELVQPGYSASTGYAETMRSVAQEKMFQKVAANAEWATDDAAVAAEKGFTQIPDSDAFGSLRGKFVEPNIADDLNQLTMKDSDMWKAMKSASRLWKFNMVVMNPATRGRNIMTNAALLDMSGTGYMTQARLVPKAMNEMRTKGEYFRLAKEHGAIGTEFVGGELQAFRKNLIGADAGGVKGVITKTANVVKGVGNKISDTYQMEEQVFKLTKFMDGIERGLAPEAAAKEARKWLIDYGAVPPIVEKLRNMPIGLPFVTFTYKAIPLVAETAVKNPMKLYKYAIIAKASNKLAKEDAGLDDREMEAATRDNKVALPGGKKDAVQTVDVGFLNPVGGLMSGEQMPGSKGKLPAAIRPSGWGMAFINLADNYNSFTAKPIWDETDTDELKVAKASNFLMGALLPAITPGAGGMYSPARGGRTFREVRDTVKGEPTYPNRDIKSPGEAAASVVGLRTKTVNPREEIVKELVAKARVAGQAKAQIKGAYKHPGIRPDERKKYQGEKIDVIKALFKREAK
jgi:hypothetical protein